MDSTGWLHLGVLLLVFAGFATFALRKMVLPAPREPPSGESFGGGDYTGGFDGGGHSGIGH
ncbi:hypothetical protein [Mesorhizobium sp. WSM4313]|uniref:hypothetical protein n=1 Tax=Mesorhizobium sp. WSM4313 TaxID=2029412 RepID=UPI000BB0B374|nr:hypothetical protein [Mesorhizobium sp. WSM4313]PBB17227.1 hypothetical protein CK219_24655 [Mesorhizobium sp. WSM4313]